MEVESDINEKLAAVATISNQKARTDAYLELLQTILAPTPSTSSLIAFGRHFVSSSSVAMVVGRRVLGDFVSALCGGSELAKKQSGDEEEQKWADTGKQVFDTEEGKVIRQEVVEGVLTPGGLAGWCEEQTTVLRHLQAELLEAEEDWLGAARAYAQIPLEGGSRTIPDEEKLAIYIKIVRLMLECGENGQAQTYHSRASLIKNNNSPKETRLQFDLCQARLYDYDCRFFEAAQAYHTLSFESLVTESDRLQMLKSAVITCILAPAGPNRTRVLAALNKDDRIQSSLPPFMSTMLTKMFLEYIVRPAELEEFEASLEQHQLGLDPEAAEATACKMIGQGRLRAWVDQPARCLYFESHSNTDQAEAKGSAGGLHIEEKEIDIEPITWTERWDNRIRFTSLQVESVSAAIQARNLLPTAA